MTSVELHNVFKAHILSSRWSRFVSVVAVLPKRASVVSWRLINDVKHAACLVAWQVVWSNGHVCQCACECLHVLMLFMFNVGSETRRQLCKNPGLKPVAISSIFRLWFLVRSRVSRNSTATQSHSDSLRSEVIDPHRKDGRLCQKPLRAHSL